MRDGFEAGIRGVGTAHETVDAIRQPLDRLHEVLHRPAEVGGARDGRLGNRRERVDAPQQHAQGVLVGTRRSGGGGSQCGEAGASTDRTARTARGPVSARGQAFVETGDPHEGIAELPVASGEFFADRLDGAHHRFERVDRGDGRRGLGGFSDQRLDSRFIVVDVDDMRTGRGIGAHATPGRGIRRQTQRGGIPRGHGVNVLGGRVRVVEYDQPVPGRTILVADDDPVILGLLEVNFEMEGYTVVTAEDGAVALDKARRSRPDIIVLDVMMPKMTGHEVAAALKADPKLANIPVVFVSAKAQGADVAKGMDLGAADYVTKPFDPIDLVDRVTAVLDKTRT